MSAHAHQPSAVKMGLPIPNSKLGMWLFLGTEIMFFTAFIGTYIVFRLGCGDLWPTQEETHIEILLGGFNTFVLIVSSYSVVVAHEAMLQKNFKKAKMALIVTLSLAFVFLGVKGVEYYGKYTHGLIPGHIPENTTQAMDKASRESEAAAWAYLTSVAPAEALEPAADPTMQKVAAVLETQHATLIAEAEKLEAESKQLAASGKKGDAADKEGEAADKRSEAEALMPTVKTAMSVAGAASNLKEHVRENVSLAIPLAKAAEMRVAGKAPEAITLEEVQAEVTKMKDAEVNDGTFSSVYDPHALTYGNLFASAYFLMTGFHAVHVLVGMLLFWIVIKQPNLEGWEDFVENSGLYWHFVDLVWIFLFPLLYIV